MAEKPEAAKYLQTGIIALVLVLVSWPLVALTLVTTGLTILPAVMISGIVVVGTAAIGSKR